MTNYINSIQKISITIAANATSATATVSAPTGTYFLIYSGQSTTDTAQTADDQCYGRIELTNSTTITAYRGVTSTTNSVTINANLIDATSNLINSVQSGTITIGAAATSNTASISAVTNANTAIAYLGSTSTNGGITGQNTACMVSLSGTTVTAQRAASTNTATAGYIVIEFQGAALNSATQPFNISYATLASTTQTITSVNVNNTMLIFGGAIAVATWPSRVFQKGVLTNATTITVSHGTAIAAQKNYCVTVVEFAGGVLNSNAQRSTFPVAATGGVTQTITSVNPTYSICNFLGASNAQAAAPLAMALYPYLALTNATTITATVDLATSTTTPSYEIIEFPAFVSFSPAWAVRSSLSFAGSPH